MPQRIWGPWYLVSLIAALDGVRPEEIWTEVQDVTAFDASYVALGSAIALENKTCAGPSPRSSL
jgi:hypothetical protein